MAWGWLWETGWWWKRGGGRGDGCQAARERQGRPRRAMGCSSPGDQLHRNVEGRKQRTGKGRKQQQHETCMKNSMKDPGTRRRGEWKQFLNPSEHSAVILTRRLAAKQAEQPQPCSCTSTVERREEEGLPSQENTFQYRKSPPRWLWFSAPSAFGLPSLQGGPPSPLITKPVTAPSAANNGLRPSQASSPLIKTFLMPGRMPGGGHATAAVPYTKWPGHGAQASAQKQESYHFFKKAIKLSRKCLSQCYLTTQR